MPTINQLSAVDEVFPGDQVPIYSTDNGDARRAPMSVIKTYMNEGLQTESKITQYAAPSSTGFSVQITDGSDSIWLILTPTAGFAAGTIVLPALANCVDKQELLLNCTQSVATLTVNGNGATVTGAPTSLAANGFFRLRFDDVADVWYRVG
jgi:hypothetical protein